MRVAATARPLVWHCLNVRTRRFPKRHFALPQIGKYASIDPLRVFGSLRRANLRAIQPTAIHSLIRRVREGLQGCAKHEGREGVFPLLASPCQEWQCCVGDMVSRAYPEAAIEGPVSKPGHGHVTARRYTHPTKRMARTN